MGTFIKYGITQMMIWKHEDMTSSKNSKILKSNQALFYFGQKRSNFPVHINGRFAKFFLSERCVG